MDLYCQPPGASSTIKSTRSTHSIPPTPHPSHHRRSQRPADSRRWRRRPAAPRFCPGRCRRTGDTLRPSRVGQHVAVGMATESVQPPCSRGACPRAGWISTLRLEWLLNHVQPPGSCQDLLVDSGHRSDHFLDRRPRMVRMVRLRVGHRVRLTARDRA